MKRALSWLRRHFYVVKLVVFISCLVYIYSKINNVVGLYQKIDDQIVLFKSLFGNPFFYLSLVLMMANWGLEALKWMVLSSFEKRLGFMRSLRGVIAGLGIGSLAPLGIGDYLGRLGVDDFKNKYQAILSIWLGHQSQLLATALFAGIGYISLFASSQPLYTDKVDVQLIGLTILVFTITVLFVFGTDILVRTCNLLLSTRELRVSKIGWGVRMSTLALSITRYLVFIFQFYLVAKCFLLEENSVQLFSSISLMFMMKSILPAFNFISDLGIREFSALYYFGKIGVEELTTLSISLTVWLINIFLPSLVGVLIILLKKWK